MTSSGIIISCYGIGSIIGGIVSGNLSDKWSPAMVLTSCLILQAIVYGAFVKLQAINYLMLNVFILGIASYGFITSNYLLVLGKCSESDGQKLKAINILSMTSNLGLGLTALIISSINSIEFYKIFVMVSPILIILSYSSFRFSKQNNLFENKAKNDHRKKEIENSESNLNKLGNKITILILVKVFFVGLIVAQLSTTYSAYIRETYRELGIKAISILFALNFFMVVVFSAPLGNFIKKFNKIIIIGIGGFLMGCAMFLLAFSGPFALTIFSCAIYTIGEIIFFSMTQLVCYENSAIDKKGKNLGLYRMIYASSRAIGPAVGGIVYQKQGGIIIWEASGIIGFLCLITSCFFKKQTNT